MKMRNIIERGKCYTRAMDIKEVVNQVEWDEMVLSHKGHPLQLWGWGEVKSRHNWQVRRLFVQKKDVVVGGAQLLIRRLPWPFTRLLYIPRGPWVADDEQSEKLLTAITNYLKKTDRAVSLCVEPDCESFSFPKGWKKTRNTILLSKTLILDLTKSEEDLLSDMSKKTRQYIHKSERQDLDIHLAKSHDELKSALAIYRDTAKRANFGIHEDQYYLDIADKLDEYSPVFIAYKDQQPVAFLWLAISNHTAFELYGGVNDKGQAIRANFALKWKAIQWCKRNHIARYDLNGLLNDGISHFKEGFAHHSNELVGTYDYPLSPLYTVWTKLLPGAKRIIQQSRLLFKLHR